MNLNTCSAMKTKDAIKVFFLHTQLYKISAIYVKPKSFKKQATLDHIKEVYHILNTMYSKGFFIIA